MRAHYFPELSKQERYLLTGDALHHLVKVVRIDVGEELLLLNGAGLKIQTKVEAISKRELHLTFLNEEIVTRPYQFSLALGMPKREALELSLKQATELGFKDIFLIRSEYSQMRFPEAERLQNLLVSALEQSNGAYLPKVIEAKWETLPWEEFSHVVMMDSQNKKCEKLNLSSDGNELLIVGPEGGFSGGEIEFLHQRPNLKIVNLPTPILRTPTALATGTGMMLESLLK